MPASPPVLHFEGHEDPQWTACPTLQEGQKPGQTPKVPQRLLRGAGHSNGLGGARWQLGPGLVRCVHIHACTQEHMHTCVYTHTHTPGMGGETRRLGMLTQRAHSSPLAPMGEG